MAETVTSVHDGDSFHVAEFKPEIRIWGIDAPEMAPPPFTKRYNRQQRIQPEAIHSRDYLKTLILGKNITLEQPGPKSSYKRPIRRVYLNGLDIGATMIHQGLAFQETRFSKGYYNDDEAFAKAHKLGIWAYDPPFKTPWEYRRLMRKQHAR